MLRWISTAAQPMGSLPRKAFVVSPLRVFAHCSSYELLRGAAVLTVCSQPGLVKRSERLLELSDRMLGCTVTDVLMRHTVFAHFVAGEDASTIVPTLQSLRENGVGGILDFAAEADLDLETCKAADVNQPARSYRYISQAVCDANMRTFLSAVEAVHATTPEGFAAVKVTALGDAALLERVSTALVELRAFFDALDSSRCGMLSRDAFLRGWCAAFDLDSAEAAAAFANIGADADGDVDYSEFMNSLPLQDVGPLVRRCRLHGPLYHSALDTSECSALDAMLARLEMIATRAKALGVRLMIDAEHSYFQPAIDHAVLHLSRKYNRDYPCIFGTYQAYLRDCHQKLELDLDRSRREGWHLGAKLVRGAYMVHERERAISLGYPDPVQPTLEATHASYDKAVDTLLLHCPCPERTSLMVASHNQASVERVAALLLDDGSRVPRDQVFFGQLLGMSDHLTFTLARLGLKTYKYVPYGPVREVLPYLIRRAQENSDALSGAAEQRDMMLAEVRRRVIGR